MLKPLNFYVYITYDNLTQNSLRIHVEFTTEHQKQILSSNNIILTVSDNKNWPMGWNISTNGHLLLQKGNTEFAFKQRSRKRAPKSAIPFKSDHPFYSVTVTLAYFKSSRLPVPIAFSRRYLTGETKSADCVLQMPNGRNWGPIQCKVSGARCQITGKNWKKFSYEHLVVGDVCVFELINEIEKLLKVTIVKAT